MLYFYDDLSNRKGVTVGLDREGYILLSILIYYILFYNII